MMTGQRSAPSCPAAPTRSTSIRLKDLAHVLGLTVSQLLGVARSTSIH
jgi:hypothetical protein